MRFKLDDLLESCVAIVDSTQVRVRSPEKRS